MQIRLTNYRCFEDIKFNIPKENFIILDKNGSGKTSILSAIYSLYTGKPLPNTKFPQYLMNKKDYFGISTQDNQWFVNGKVTPSGRITTKYSCPIPTPKNILTYQPNDNYWLQQSRSSKLSTLDEIIGQTNPIYPKLITELEKISKNKLQLLKESNKSEFSDMIMVNFLGKKILELSKEIWEIRWGFLIKINDNMNEFTEMIRCPIQNWQVQTEITSFNGNKINILNLAKYKYENFDLKKNSSNLINSQAIFKFLNLDNVDFEKLWQRELACEKVLFGANRDDFGFISNKLKIEHVLSRGEIRLFVLWIKKTGINPKNTIWLLDDIFNELDHDREEFLMSKIFLDCDQIIATGTRCSLINLDKYTIKKLML